MRWSSFAAALAGTRIGSTFNQYAASSRLERRLAGYLERTCTAQLLLVGEAAGYRGARVSGLPFTSERQLTGSGPAEASATSRPTQRGAAGQRSGTNRDGFGAE